MLSKLMCLTILFISIAATQKDLRLEGGFQANPKQYPFAAAIYHNSKYFCSGTLISTKWVLTSGYCTDMFGNDPLVVSLGGLKNVVEIETGRHDIPSLKHYSLFSNESVFVDNIGLLELAFDVTLSAYIRPIELPKRDSVVQPHTDGMVLGYRNNTLHFGVTDTLFETECTIDGDLNYDLTFCTDYIFATGTPCNDDAGTLFLSRSDGSSRTHVGILADGGCSTKESVFTRTSMYLEWISEITGMYLP